MSKNLDKAIRLCDSDFSYFVIKNTQDAISYAKEGNERMALYLLNRVIERIDRENSRGNYEVPKMHKKYEEAESLVYKLLSGKK